MNTSDFPSDPHVRRAIACALGSAIGDALGMPTEFGPRRLAASDRVLGYTAGRHPAGTYTDDTEMALCLAFSLLAIRRFDAENFRDHLLAWFEAGPADLGHQTRKALCRHMANSNYQAVCFDLHLEDPTSAGNGTICRLWPLAIASHGFSRNYRLRLATRSGSLTHPGPDARDCEAATMDLLHDVLGGISLGKALRRAIRQRPWLDPRGLDEVTVPNSGYAPDTLRAAVWALSATESFEAAVLAAANLGNDSASIAALTGAIGGAAYGLEAIPKHLAAGLRGDLRGYNPDAADLATLAINLTRLGKPS